MNGYIDHAEIKLGQIITIAIASTALALQQELPLLILGALFLLAGTLRSLSPVSLLYHWVVRPLRLMRSDYRLDNIQPHKFGQLIGAATVIIALALFEYGFTVAGWGVVVVLIALTVVSYAGWCIGCFLYYQFNRLGLGGFFRHAPKDRGVFPGMRPRRARNDNGA